MSWFGQIMKREVSFRILLSVCQNVIKKPKLILDKSLQQKCLIIKYRRNISYLFLLCTSIPISRDKIMKSKTSDVNSGHCTASGVEAI